MKSIMQKEKKCFICGANGQGDPLESHHLFFGQPNRQKSEKHGLKVWLCGSRCHRLGPESVHMNKTMNMVLKAEGQQEFEKTHTREEFIKEFGRSYL